MTAVYLVIRKVHSVQGLGPFGVTSIGKVKVQIDCIDDGAL